jgi:hypothetical protein
MFVSLLKQDKNLTTKHSRCYATFNCAVPAVSLLNC